MTLSILGLGFVLGLKHALDTDHLIAVTTIVGERKGIANSAGVGVLWGLGHTASLLIFGVAVIALHIQIPQQVALLMELGVAIMLVSLGVNVIYKLVRGGLLHTHIHVHGTHVHAHPHIHEHAYEHDHATHALSFGTIPQHLRDLLSSGKKSVFIGMVHGLAGSAALMLIVLATIPSTGLALAYIGIFGFGSVGGMMVMSALIGIPFLFTAQKSDRLNHLIRLVSGVLSIAFGLFYGWQIAIVERLLF